MFTFKLNVYIHDEPALFFVCRGPVDKLSKLFTYEDQEVSHPYESCYHCSFQPADNVCYEAGRTRPVIDGYYTQVKPVIEQAARTKSEIKLSLKQDGIATGAQRYLGTVKNLRDTKRRTHGIITTSSTDIRQIMFPGSEDDEKHGSEAGEVAGLKSRIYGAKSNSDPSGGRTWKALRYESCGSSDEPKNERQTQSKYIDRDDHLIIKPNKFKRNTNFINNKDLNEKYLLLQEALQYLTKIRSSLIRNDKSVVDRCRKTSASLTRAEDAIQMLNSKSSVHIDYSKLEPIFDSINIKTINSKSITKLWDLFDHHLPLSEFKFGRLVKSCPETQAEPLQKSNLKTKQNKAEMQARLQLRFKAKQFKDFDTAGDLISPKPGTPLGLGHVDYFLPRVSEDIKIIFRNFDLDERTFERAWKEARKLENCEMNKVSAENFRKILNQNGIELLRK